MTTLIVYCHGTEMPRCNDCQRLGNWADLGQMPAALRDGLVKESLCVNRMHCEMTAGAHYVPAMEVAHV